MLRIKNWKKFQHFTDRKPPWIKLYRDLLDDIEWHKLNPEASKVLVMLWLIASESDGNIPDTTTLAWRLRLSEKKLMDAIQQLNHWLERDDDEMMPDCHQDDALETEKRERREETEAHARIFDCFWQAYPKKKSKGQAEKAWDKINPTREQFDSILEAIERAKTSEEWKKDRGQYIPYPATWLNAKGWEDEIQTVYQPPAPDPEKARRRQEELDQMAERERERMERNRLERQGVVQP